MSNPPLNPAEQPELDPNDPEVKGYPLTKEIDGEVSEDHEPLVGED